ncbi:MAG TPA: hypothetical protein VK589_20620 [Chryseolinea sp.]|nr:hypothetical protein [Chryseolinea sp.]
MILYFLQHCPFLVLLAKTYFAGAFSQYFNALTALIQVLIQGRQLSIRDTFFYYQTIALSHHQNKKRTHA